MSIEQYWTKAGTTNKHHMIGDLDFAFANPFRSSRYNATFDGLGGTCFAQIGIHVSLQVLL